MLDSAIADREQVHAPLRKTRTIPVGAVNRVRTAPLTYGLARLRMASAVLHLGAHPDDEEIGMLAYMSHRGGARVVYWSATRGEGGQNQRGPERGEALGIVRSWESLEARSIDGGEVLYGPFYDFGFSKSGEDTLERWGREDVVREIVRAIRLVQPLVVVSRWSGGGSDGHGHHKAIGLVAAEAFEAAADPARFPELIEFGLAPWQAQKLYRSVAGDWQPGEGGTFGTVIEEYERAGCVRINTGLLDPIAGKSYQEQAHQAINCHRSQGMGFVPEPGPYYYYFRLERSLVSAPGLEADFFDGLDPTILGLADYPGEASRPVREALTDVLAQLDEAIMVFRPQRPEPVAAMVLTALDRLRALRKLALSSITDPGNAAALDAYLARKAADFEAVAAACLGLRAECLLDRPRVAPGSKLGVTARLWIGGDATVSLRGVTLAAPAGWQAKRTGSSRSETGERTAVEEVFDLSVPADARITAPYWLRAPRTPYRYAWPELDECSEPFDPALVVATFDVAYGRQRFCIGVPAVYRSGFPGGSRELPLSVLPSIAVAPRSRQEMLPVSAEPFDLQLEVTLRSMDEDGSEATLELAVPAGWLVEPVKAIVSLALDQSQLLRFKVTLPANCPAGQYGLRYRVDGDETSAVEIQPVRLAALGCTGPADASSCVAEAFQVQPASIEVRVIDAVFVPTLNYGYVQGAKEQILSGLARFGLDVRVLSDDELGFADLSTYQCIVVGPNAYNMRPALRENAERLLEYVKQGGCLVVQYQGYGYDDPGLAPYPFRYNQPHDRVTAPDAPVVMMHPDDPLVNTPNRLSAEDFVGWVVDRGLYFFGEWDRRYTPILASADRGEEPRHGGLVSAAYGRGQYVYAAYSFFRQIPAGVPGAVRLFANLLGLVEASIRRRAELLGGIELFASMAKEELYEAARLMSEFSIPAGAILAREGERGDELYVLVEGSINVLKSGAKGEQLVHVARPGEAIGEFAALASIPRSASLVAATDATLITLPNKVFEQVLKRYPDLSLQLMRQLVRKIIPQVPADR